MIAGARKFDLGWEDVAVSVFSRCLSRKVSSCVDRPPRPSTDVRVWTVESIQVFLMLCGRQRESAEEPASPSFESPTLDAVVLHSKLLS